MDSLPGIVCVGLVVLAVPIVVCLVLAVKLSELKQRVERLEGRLTEMARERMRPGKAAEAGGTGREETRPVEYLVKPPAYPVAAARDGSVVTGTAGERPTAAPVQGSAVQGPTVAPVQVPAAQGPVVARPEVVPANVPAASVPAILRVPSAPVAAATRLPTVPAAPVGGMKAAGGKAKAAAPRTLESYLIPAFIVVGAILLALAAIFLVKIGIDKKVFGPLQRDWASVIGALILVGMGQWWRKRLGFWSQGLIGAGLVAFFAAIFAATTLHKFLTPVQGFVALGLATAGAVAMSLQDWSGGTEGGKRGGVLIAALGLLGGFLTPVLVNSGQDNVPGLFGYLILLHVGLIATTRLRGWSILAGASTGLSSLWLILWVLLKWNPEATPGDGLILGMFMLASAGILVVATATRPEKWSGGKSGVAGHVLTWVGVALAMVSACLLVGKSHYDNLQWAFFALLAGGAFVLARLRVVYEGMAALASAVVLVMLVVWGTTVMLTGDVSGAVLAEHGRFEGWLVGMGIGSVLASYAGQWKSAVPWRWALLASLLAVAYVVTGYVLVPAAPRPDAWAWVPLAAGGVLAALMVPVLLRRERFATAETTLAIYGHAVLVMLVMAPPMGLRGGELTAAWAAVLPVTALAIWRLRLPDLLLGFMVATVILAARLLLLQTVGDAGGEGRYWYWNPVVWAYGSALVGTAAAAWLLEQCGEAMGRVRGAIPGARVMAAILQAMSAACALLLVTLEVRWVYHGGRLGEPTMDLMERSTQAVATLLLAAVLAWLGKQARRVIVLRCGQVAAVAGMAYTVGALVLVTNPMWWGQEDVGGVPVLNLLLYAYGAPAALCGLLAWVLRWSDPEHGSVGTTAGAAGLVVLFALVSLEVRQGFAGGRLMLGEGMPVSFVEFATYSTAWLALGAALLAIGKRWAVDVVRRGGIWVCSLAVAYAIVVVGLVENPFFHAIRVGERVIVNDLLYAFGLPLALAGLAAWILHPVAEGIFGLWTEDSERPFAEGWKLGWVLRAGMMVLLFILVTTEVRQGFRGACLHTVESTFGERATYPIAWMACGGVLLGLGYRWGSVAARRGGLTFAALALGGAVLIETLIMNPLFTRERVGSTIIFNGLLYAYGLPAAALAGLAWYLWKRAGRVGGTVAERVHGWFHAIGSLLLIFALVTLEVQHAFRGDNLSFGPSPPGTPSGEIAAYSIAWALLGIAYLIVGIVRRSLLLRAASLVMMLLTIPKIFLFDIAVTHDFQRVLSFTGVGVCLLLLAFVYQRFVFRRSPTTTTEPAAKEEDAGRE